MQFKLGDKILFKTENQKGVIVKINSSYKVTVQTEDGFEVLASVKDLVKVEVNTDKALAYGNCFYQKDNDNKSSNSFKRDKSSTILKIDLHIELLSGSYHGQKVAELLHIPLNQDSFFMYYCITLCPGAEIGRQA